MRPSRVGSQFFTGLAQDVACEEIWLSLPRHKYVFASLPNILPGVAHAACHWLLERPGVPHLHNRVISS